MLRKLLRIFNRKKWKNNEFRYKTRDGKVMLRKTFRIEKELWKKFAEKYPNPSKRLRELIEEDMSRH